MGEKCTKVIATAFVLKKSFYSTYSNNIINIYISNTFKEINYHKITYFTK